MEEDTEWNDILRAHGVLPPKKKESDDEDNAVVEESLDEARQRQLDEVALDELDQLDGFEDDHFMEAYRRQRIAEMNALAATECFGELVQISEPDFVREVTEASKEAWVVVHLFQDSLPVCRLLNERLAALATKYRATKFVKIISTDCIRNYPDRNLPTLLVYNEGDMQRQMVGAAQLGGLSIDAKVLEQRLAQIGAISNMPAPARSRPAKSSNRLGARRDSEDDYSEDNENKDDDFDSDFD
ncbi:phosducin family protein [Thamnocephalis sphaerospora]|uniref:Phosducin family protein n=1 Tax=Thamnocephalis sphaerospora TaxID=78915 RepID=A0A4P9XRE4_9FUNG|nr:phosducin family protein [Thamnocephalis sphaerospora]|eukprot:RKP08654.1 phosducin family protein [Thamnocephalis sphaerospora]